MPSKHSQTGSLLPEDIISALGQELVGSSTASDDEPVPDASGPLATPEDFAKQAADSEMGIARQRLERTLKRVRGSRPWMIALLMCLLIVSALYARLQDVEQELQAERRDMELKTARLARMRADKMTRRVKYPINVLLTSEPPGATVVQGGTERGKTPLDLTFTKGGMQQFIVKMDGFRDLDYRINPAGLKRDQDPVPLKLKLSKLDVKKAAEVQAPLIVSHGTKTAEKTAKKVQGNKDDVDSKEPPKVGTDKAGAKPIKADGPGLNSDKRNATKPQIDRSRPPKPKKPRKRKKRPASDELVNPFE